MKTVGRIRGMVALSAAALAFVVTGCASTSSLPGHGGGSGSLPAGTANRPAADPAEVAVVQRWASSLRKGDIADAAKTFALPSVFINGATEQVEIKTLAESEAVQQTLPCGAEVISAFQDGRYINVLFRLVAREGRGGGPSACGSGVGSTARTEFLIHNGLIKEWLRAPSLRGDPGAPTTPSGGGTATGPTV